MAVRRSRALAAASVIGAACTPRPGPPGPVAFARADAWVVQGADTFPLLVEIARTDAEQEVGLSGRPSLDARVGMVFEFDEVRSGDDGFWMWRTLIPLDVAFVDDAGVIRRILGMEPCEADAERSSCPGYFPGVEYTAALEVNRGWFAAHGVAVGARLSWTRRSPGS